MKRHEEKVARLLKAELPSAEEVELAGLEVLERLRSSSASAEVPNEHGLRIPADEISTKILEDMDWNRPVRPWWQILPIWAAAALAALVLLSIPLARRFVTNRTVYAIVDNEDGARYRVAAGQIVATDVWTRSTLTLPDGSRVEMHPQSQLSVNGAADGLRIQLDKGGIIVTAARQRSGHLYVDTKDVAVSVVGTVFLVGVEEAGSRVAVLEGTVEVKQAGLTRTLVPPGQMVTNPMMELPSLREQVSWSRYAIEHLALLKQFAAPEVAKTAEQPVQMVQTEAAPKSPQLNPPNLTAPRPQFEVASVKLNKTGNQAGSSLRGNVGRFSATNVPLSVLIRIAYNVQDFQIIGSPAWINSERYDIEAKGEGNLDSDKVKGPMLQALIEERFKAVVHGETRDLPVYFLTVAKSGSKLKPSECMPRDPSTPVSPGQPQPPSCNTSFGNGIIKATGTQIDFLAGNLSGILKRKVLDRTGLVGRYDAELKWMPDISTPGFKQEADPAADGGPSIFTAIEEQLGLKLESGKAPIDVLVIDHIDHASDN